MARRSSAGGAVARHVLGSQHLQTGPPRCTSVQVDWAANGRSGVHSHARPDPRGIRCHSWKRPLSPAARVGPVGPMRLDISQHPREGGPQPTLHDPSRGHRTSVPTPQPHAIAKAAPSRGQPQPALGSHAEGHNVPARRTLECRWRTRRRSRGRPTAWPGIASLTSTVHCGYEHNKASSPAAWAMRRPPGKHLFALADLLRFQALALDARIATPHEIGCTSFWLKTIRCRACAATRTRVGSCEDSLTTE